MLAKGSKTFLIIAAAAMIFSWSDSHAASEVTQSFSLHPGWNAIYLEVQPDPSDTETVFSELENLESVWAWLDTHSTAEFIRDPDEGLWNQPGWGVYHTAPERQFLNSLHAVIAGWTYLIKLAGDEDVSFQVTGIPSIKKTEWNPDAFNLVGFHVNPSNSPFFANFFSASSAHSTLTIYKFSATSGKWEFVDNPASVEVDSGEAYWIYSEGSSSYQGLLDIDLPLLGGLNFGQYADTLTIALHNVSDAAMTVAIEPLSADISLTYRTYNSTLGAYEWPPLEQMPDITLAAGTQQSVKISVRRADLQTDQADSVVQISSSTGTRLLVPVHVEKEVSQ
jgi:hypothetical protein